jgi:hypothetical protein
MRQSPAFASAVDDSGSSTSPSTCPAAIWVILIRPSLISMSREEPLETRGSAAVGSPARAVNSAASSSSVLARSAASGDGLRRMLRASAEISLARCWSTSFSATRLSENSLADSVTVTEPVVPLGVAMLRLGRIWIGVPAPL